MSMLDAGKLDIKKAIAIEFCGSTTAAGGATVAGDVNKRIAAELVARFSHPIIAPVVPDGDVDVNYQVGVQCMLSLNKHAPIDQMGRLDATVHVQSHSRYSGFQGGAYYRLMDRGGNVVYAVLGSIYGVNGRWIPGAQDNRTEHETIYIPFEVMTDVFSVIAERARMEGSALDNLKKTVGDFAKGIDEIKADLQKVGADIQEIAGAVSTS